VGHKPVLAAAAVAMFACAPAMRSTIGHQPDAKLMAQFWVQPQRDRGRNLIYGTGGPTLAPAPDVTYTLVRRVTHGFSPKMEVKDPSGMKWDVKTGPEAQPEVVASRIVWALGYHQVPDYFVPTYRVEGNGRTLDLGPARFRPHVKWIRKEGSWSWHSNPFVDTEAFRGLVVLMMMLNSTDLKDDNNGLYDLGEPIEHADRWYVVKDLGATLGETGRQSPKRGDPEAFERSGFITGVKGNRVLFDFQGRHQELLSVVRPADVLWMCAQLRRLSPDEWHDAFRAGGYDDPQTERFLRKLQEKIAQGEAIGKRGGA
jgi:hypothetical protein